MERVGGLITCANRLEARKKLRYAGEDPLAVTREQIAAFESLS
jgi:hypothetical protein